MSTLHDITELLTSIKASGSFAARRTASADDLHLEVKGVGGITWPTPTTVTHVTRRTGRPFTLVLVKTGALFEREAAERQLWQRDRVLEAGM